MTGLFKQCQRWLAALGTVALLAACGGQDSDVATPAPPAPPAAVAPTFTLQPTDTQATAGTEVRFTANAQGTAVTWTWQRSTDAGTSWVAIANATTATLTLPAVTLADTNTRLRAVATSGGLQTISSGATLTVAAQVTPPAISVQIAPAQAVAGSSVTLAITATGTALQYQWQSSRDGSTWVDVAGAIAATLQLQNLTLDANGTQYRVVVRNAAGSVTSGVTTLSVTAPPMTPAFSLQPQAASVTAPNTATFTVAVTGQPAPTVQWQRSSNAGATYSDIAGATAASYTTAATTLADSGALFRARASNSAGSATSTAATLTVAAALVAPAITTQPLDVSVVSGQTATWSVAATGVPAPTFQWQLSSDGGTTFANINGATSSSYSLVTAVADNGKRVRVLASNSQGTATSRAAVLGVTAPAGGLNGRDWAGGRRFNDLNELVTSSTGATAVIDRTGRLHMLYTSATLIPVQHKLWVVTSLPGAPGASPVFGTPVLLAASVVPVLPSNIVLAANGSATAIWLDSSACPPGLPAGCIRTWRSQFEAASGNWGAGMVTSDQEASLLNGRTNDVGDQIALPFPGVAPGTPGGAVLTWRQAGRTDIETLALPTAEPGDLLSLPVGISLDNNGGFVIVLGKVGINASQNLVARRGNIRTRTLGPEELLENRAAPAAFDGMWSNSAGQVVVMWNQDNGTRVTRFAATLDSAAGSWAMVDTGLAWQNRESFQAVMSTLGDFHWYSFSRCTTVRRVGVTWTAQAALPSDLCGGAKQAVANNGNVLVVDPQDGRWASFDASRQALVRGLVSRTPNSGPGFVLGTSWRNLPGTLLFNDSGIGAYVSVNEYDTLPSTSAPNGDSRSDSARNIWALFFK